MKEMANWTAERIDTLKRLAGENCTASHIASVLGDGVTRSAVCARAARLGVKLNGGAGGQAGPRKPRPSEWRMKRGPASPPVVPPAPLLEPESLILDGRTVSIMEVSDKRCRWPKGDPTDVSFHFCGHPPTEQSPYCEFHQRLAWAPAKRSAA